MSDQSDPGFFNSWRQKALDSVADSRGTGLRGLAENVLSLSLLQAAGYILPLITVPYLVRVLGVDLYGLVMFAIGTIQYFIIFTDFGFNLSATREIAANRGDIEKVSRIFSAAFTVRLLFLIAGFAILYLLTATINRLAESPTVFLLSYGMVVGNVLFPLWLFQGMEKMKYSTILTIVARALFVVLIFVFVRSADDYILVPALHSIGWIVAGALSLVVARRTLGVRYHVPTPAQLWHQVTQSSQFFLATAASTAFSSFNTLVLGFASTNRIVGYYVAAEKIYIAMRSGFYPIVNALYPYMVRTRNVRLYRKLFAGFFALGLTGAALLYMFSDPIITLIFGSGFETSASLMRLFSALIPIIVASLLIGYPLLAAMGHIRYANMSTLVGSVLHIGLVFIFISNIDPFRLVVIMLGAESVILAIKLYAAVKYRLWRVPPSV